MVFATWPAAKRKSESWNVSVESCFGCCAPLVELLSSLLVRPRGHNMDREEFERTVAFLETVQLFRRQLPRAELPKVAQSLICKTWKPQQKLVQQGELGRAFFLIQSGEALVVTRSGEEPEQVRATMGAGDYFGGHTLMTDRPNVSTIIAKGPDPLVTLSMSRADFEECGLKRRLHFPKRPAIYEGSFTDTFGDADALFNRQSSPLDSPEEFAFMHAALRKNVNLRALLETSEDILKSVAESAVRRQVDSGVVVAKSGCPGKEFFVIREGSFDVVVENGPELCGGESTSAEEWVQKSTMAERLLRKQHFLRHLSSSSSAEKDKRRMSNIVDALRKPSSSGSSREKIVRFFERPRSLLRPSNNVFSPAPREQAFSAEWTPCTIRRSRTKGTVSGPGVTPVRSGVNSDGLCSALEVRDRALKFSSMQSAKDKAPNRDGHRNTLAGDVAPQHEDEGENSVATCTLGPGDSFGELSLLYNARREATFRAREKSVIYVVGQKAFKALVNRKGPRFKEYLNLLDEVHTLSPLLSSERFELACNVTGHVNFKPHERVLHQDKVREARQWYVVVHGSGVMTQDGVVLGNLRRSHHFGERSLLRGDAASQVNVDAGAEGMSCLTFDWETVKTLLQSLFKSDEGLPSVHSDIKDWCKEKATGFGSEAFETGIWERQVTVSYIQEVELDAFQQVALLGRGAFGSVSLVAEKSSQKRFALKKLSKGHVQSKGAGRQVRWERELLSMVDTVFVIKLYRTYQDADFVYFLLEAALGGNLLEVLNDHADIFVEDNPRGFSASFYAACVIGALEHLHERCIVYRDLKPENALIDSRGYAKLCDMGFARFVLGKTNTLAGTPDYMAPEMIDFPHTHDQGVDWWALGVFMYELLTGQTPWEDEGITDVMGRLLAIRRSQASGRLIFPFHFPFSCKGFVSALLRKQSVRLGCTGGGASEVRRHAMFSSMRFDFDAFNSMTMQVPFVKPWSNDWETIADTSSLFASQDGDDCDCSWMQGF